jgi:hypothetical protein
MKNKVAEFTPVSSDRAVPQTMREKLSAVKIMPTAKGTLTPVAMGSYASVRDDNRSAQLSK